MKFESINEVCIKWRKDLDNAILGEVKEKAIENGIKIEYLLNEKAIISALEKQIPKVAEHEDGVWSLCPCCGGSVCNDTEYAVNKEVSYCEHCGQAIDWKNSGLE